MFKSTTNIFHSFFSILIISIIIISINILSSFYYIRYDVTEEKLFTLSDNTKLVLGKLEKPVTIRFYFSKNLETMSQSQKTFAKHISDLLKEFENIGNDKLTIEKLDPSDDLSIEIAAKFDGVMGQNIANGNKQYFGLSFSYFEKTEVIPFLKVLDEKNIEYKIIRNILKVTRERKKVIGIISNLPVIGYKPTAALIQDGRYDLMKPWVAFNELQKDFILKRLPFDLQKIEGVDAIAIIHPIGFPAKTKFIIDQYILKGGKVFIALDSFSLRFTKQAKKNKGFEIMTKSNMPKMLKNWGVSFDTSKVLGDMTYATNSNSATEMRTYITAPLFTNKAFNQTTLISNQLEKVNFIFPGAFVSTPVAGLTKSNLITSSINSSLITNKVSESPTESFRDFKADSLSYPVAIRIHGLFKTSFPNYVGNDKVNSLSVAKKKGTVILVSDTDFMENSYSVVEKTNPYGSKYYIPKNDNMTFLYNIFDSLCGDEYLTNIRARKMLDRPFIVLEKINKEAQMKFKDDILSLKKDLIIAQNKIHSLQALKDKKDQTILNSDQKRELEIFKRKQNIAKKKAEKYQKTYQKSIDKILNKLKLINILAIPFIITIIGIIIALIAKIKQLKGSLPIPNMKSNKYNSKYFIISIIIALLLISSSVYMYLLDMSTWEKKSDRGILLIKNFNVNTIEKIEINTQEESFVINKKEGKWLLKNVNNYPADFKQISELLLTLSELKVIHSFNLDKKDLSKFYLEEDNKFALVLKLFDKNNELKNSLHLGKHHIEVLSVEENPFLKKEADGRYLKLNNSNKVYLVNDSLSKVQPIVPIWMLKSFVRFGNPKELLYRTMDNNNKWSLYRDSPKAPFLAQIIKHNETINYKAVNTIVKELYEIAIINAVPLTSFNFATKVKGMLSFNNFNNFSYYIKIIEFEKKYYLKLDILYTQPTNYNELSKKEQNKVKEAKKLYEREQFFSKWLFEIEKECSENLMQSRSSMIKLIEKKEAK